VVLNPKINNFLHIVCNGRHSFTAVDIFVIVISIIIIIAIDEETPNKD